MMEKFQLGTPRNLYDSDIDRNTVCQTNKQMISRDRHGGPVRGRYSPVISML